MSTSHDHAASSPGAPSPDAGRGGADEAFRERSGNWRTYWGPGGPRGHHDGPPQQHYWGFPPPPPPPHHYHHDPYDGFRGGDHDGHHHHGGPHHGRHGPFRGRHGGQGHHHHHHHHPRQGASQGGPRHHGHGGPHHGGPHRGRGGGGGGGGPAGRRLMARFVKHVTVDAGTLLAPGTAFTKIWRLRNDSPAPWPAAVSLLVVGGEGMVTSANGPAFEVPGGASLAPGQELDVSLAMTAPARPGAYQTFFRLADSSTGQKFGQRFWAEIQVGTPNGCSSSSSSSEAEEGGGPPSPKRAKRLHKRRTKVLRKLEKLRTKVARFEGRLARIDAKLARRGGGSTATVVTSSAVAADAAAVTTHAVPVALVAGDSAPEEAFEKLDLSDDGADSDDDTDDE